jgi:ABC-2 type transport system permease protein
MLWRKAWLETRTRFLISLAGITALCSFVVYHGNQGALPYTQAPYYYFVLQSGHSLLCMMWVLGVTLLMMGGLVREKAVGTAPFTLSLPVSRTQLMGVRIATGAIQSIALAVIPWCAMFLIATTSGKVNPLRQACFYVVLLAGGGLVFFGVSLLVSTLVEGEYTAPVVSFGVMLAMTVVMGDGRLRYWSPFGFINAIEFFDRHTGLLRGPIPWAHTAISAGLAAVLVWIAVKVIERREF